MRLWKQSKRCATLPNARLLFDSSVGQRCLVAQTMNQGGGSSSGGNGAAAQSNAGASSDSTTDRLLRKKFFDLLVQVDTRCCVPVQSHMSRCSTAGDYRTPR